MKIRELIDQLCRLPSEDEIMILDGFNGGGEPREINFGPVSHSVTQDDMANASDCEDMEPDQTVWVIGYGSY